MKRHSLVRNARRHLLCSIPALVLILPGTALAQSSGVTSDGRATLTNDQRAQSSTVQGGLANPPATIRATSLSDAQARLAGNAATASAKANDAQSDLASDIGAGPGWPVRVNVDGDAVTADAATLILSRQSVRGANAFAEALASGYALDIGEADQSQGIVEANLQSALARDNDHLATLSDTTGSGAGIVTVQRGDQASAVRSTLGGMTSLTVQNAEASTLRLDHNRQQSVASGNGANLALGVTSPTQVAGNSNDATAVIAGRDVGVSVGSAIVAQQIWSGPATARIGVSDAPAGFLSVAGTLSGSSVSADANVLAAAAFANQAVTEHRSDAALAGDLGAVATSLAVQDVNGAVSADIIGGVGSHVLGPVDRSTLSVSSNTVSTTATGNAADNFLRGSAAIVTRSSEGGSQMPGSAWVSPDAMTGTSGAYTIHTEQHADGAGISARIVQGSSNIGADGPISGSQILANDNRQAAEAVANDASSLLDLAGSSFAGSTVSSLVQSNDAGVGTFVGGGEDFGGATISPADRIQDSRLEIRNNLIEAQSVGNRGTNRLAFSVADSPVPKGIVHGLNGSRAGSVDNGFGVSASAALSSFQKTGQLGNAPLIASEIRGRFSVTGDGATDGTTTLIIGNRQQAQATANSADNGLHFSSANRNGAGSALDASQYGDATVRAVSGMRVVAHGALENATSTIAGHSNLAAAMMNGVSNRLEVDAAGAGGSGLAMLRADPVGKATGEADDILVSTQFATGSVLADATTMLAGSEGSASLGAMGPALSRFDISGNVTAALATGNQAVSTAVLNGSGSGGIASSQINLASTAASASTSAFLAVPPAGRSVVASEISVADNASSALARGNFAENRATFELVSMPFPASVQVDRFLTSVEAPIGLVSAQANYGAISAAADGGMASIPLNYAVPVDASRIAVTGNTMSATAYGNGVANTVASSASSLSGVALVSAQTNYGSVTARAVAPVVSLMPGSVAASSLGIVNTSLSASATGNLATNVVGIPR